MEKIDTNFVSSLQTTFIAKINEDNNRNIIKLITQFTIIYQL